MNHLHAFIAPSSIQASWFQRVSDSVVSFVHKHEHGIKLTLTAAAASAMTASAIITYQQMERKLRADAVKRELYSRRPRDITLSSLGTIESTSDFDVSLIDEQLARNIAFLGREGVDHIRQAKVIIIGVGAIGSYCAVLLARSGAKSLELIDPGIVSAKTLSLHATAKVADIGQPKVTAIQRYLQQVSPFVKLGCHVEVLTRWNLEGALAGDPDFVIDTLGDGCIEIKAQLVKYCKEHHLPIVSAMTTSGKVDPTRLQVSDISNTFSDPQCRRLRRRLRKLGVYQDVLVAFSSEKPTLSVDNDHDGRLTSFGPVAAMFGLSLATTVILKIGKFPEDPTKEAPRAHGPEHPRTRSALEDIQHRELLATNKKQSILDAADVGYIIDEMWHQKSVLSGAQQKLTLVRWDRSRDWSYFNAVAMTRAEAKEHDQLPPGTNLADYYGHEVASFVKQQQDEERLFENMDHRI